jgi:hypothetical protein
LTDGGVAKEDAGGSGIDSTKFYCGKKNFLDKVSSSNLEQISTKKQQRIIY